MHDPTPDLLFAYGTLGPAGPEAAARGGWKPDAIRGRLYHLGPYPALIGLDDPAAGWVEGHVRPVDRVELETRLDPYEGVDEGLYQRRAATTRAGRRVWVYVYARPLPQYARGPMPRWEGPRVGPLR
jgi:indolepyruvate decarboxylase